MYNITEHSYERILEANLTPFIEIILEKSQSGFRKKDTENCNKTNVNVAKAAVAFVAFKDLENVFDKAPRQIIWALVSELIRTKKSLHRNENESTKNMKSEEQGSNEPSTIYHIYQ